MAQTTVYTDLSGHTYDTKEITFSGSPQTITIQDPDNGNYSERISLKLEIWTGNKTPVPADGNTLKTIYNLNEPIGGIEDLSISTLTNFSLDSFLAAELFNQPYTDNYLSAAVWYRYTATGDNGNTPYVSSTKLATSGYGFYKDNINAGTTIAEMNGRVFGNQSTKLFCHNSGTYTVPVYVGDTSTNKSIVTKNQIITFDSLNIAQNSITSSAQIAFVPINAATFGSEWTNGSLKYLISSAVTEPTFGLRFNGTDSYMDLGTVPLLNSADSYVKMKFQATNWGGVNHPFGYENSGADRFTMFRISGGASDVYKMMVTGQVLVNPSEYPTPDNYQEFLVYALGVGINNSLSVEIDGILLGTTEDIEFIPRSESGMSFYLGARNNQGVPSNFTEIVFTEFESFNGTETFTANDANNWNGGLNYGGERVFTFDDTVAQPVWQTAEDLEYYELDIMCAKANPSSLIYYNSYGAQTEIPINGRVEDVTTVNREQYTNKDLNFFTEWDPEQHERKTFTSNGRDAFNVNTGWITEETNQMMKEAIHSKSVWLRTEGEVMPVNVINKTLSFIDRRFAPQEGYTLQLEAANKVKG